MNKTLIKLLVIAGVALNLVACSGEKETAKPVTAAQIQQVETTNFVIGKVEGQANYVYGYGNDINKAQQGMRENYIGPVMWTEYSESNAKIVIIEADDIGFVNNKVTPKSFKVQVINNPTTYSIENGNVIVTKQTQGGVTMVESFFQGNRGEYKTLISWSGPANPNRADALNRGLNQQEEIELYSVN